MGAVPSIRSLKLISPRTVRWSRRILLPLAAIPLLQTTGCDPGSLAVQFGSNLAISGVEQLISVLSSNFVQFLITTFPGSGFLRATLGAGT